MDFLFVWRPVDLSLEPLLLSLLELQTIRQTNSWADKGKQASKLALIKTVPLWLLPYALYIAI